MAIAIVLIAAAPIALRLSKYEPEALALREWITAYSGLLGIGAAIFAAIPVFEQLDETRIGSDIVRIQLIAGAQHALDDERARVKGA